MKQADRTETMKPKRRGGTGTLLLTSFLWLCICMLSFLSVTWAWFSIGVTNRGSLIVSATFTLATSVESTESAPVYIDESGRYYLSAGTEYIVTLTNEGSADSGYCRLTLGEELYYTPQIIKNTNFSFRIISPEDAFLQIESFWGSPGEDVTLIESTP